MIKLLLLFLAYLLPWSNGYLLVAWLDKKNQISFGYKFFAGFLIGAGLVTMQILTLGLLGYTLKAGLLLLVQLATLVILEMLLYWSSRRFVYPRYQPAKSSCLRFWRGFWQNRPSVKIVSLIVLLVILFKVWQSIWAVWVLPPAYDFDAWNNWNLRAKVIFYQQKIPLDKSAPDYLGGGMKSYPLHDPLFKMWVASILGQWSEKYLDLYSVIYYLVLLGLFWCALPKNFNSLTKILGIYLLSSIPFLFIHSQIAYADLASTAHLFLAVSALWLFAKEKVAGYLWLASLGLALNIWTKNEGLTLTVPLLLIISLLLVISKDLTVKKFILFWLLAVVASLPWLLLRFTHQLEFLNGDTNVFKFGWQRATWPIWFSLIFVKSHFLWLWWMVFLGLLLKLKLVWQNIQLRVLAIMVVVLFAGYNGIFLLTDRGAGYNAAVRLNMQLVPLGVLLLTLLLAEILANCWPNFWLTANKGRK